MSQKIFIGNGLKLDVLLLCLFALLCVGCGRKADPDIWYLSQLKEIQADYLNAFEYKTGSIYRGDHLRAVQAKARRLVELENDADSEGVTPALQDVRRKVRESIVHSNDVIAILAAYDNMEREALPALAESAVEGFSRIVMDPGGSQDESMSGGILDMLGRAIFFDAAHRKLKEQEYSFRLEWANLLQALGKSDPKFVAFGARPELVSPAAGVLLLVPKLLRDGRTPPDALPVITVWDARMPPGFRAR